MNKKILLFSRDPGGANTIIPLINPLRAKGYLVELYGKDFALERYKKSGYEVKNIVGEGKLCDKKYLISFLRQKRLKAIITGTSIDDLTENYMWKAAEELNIPSFAILDNWINYGLRFLKYSSLPTKIFVMDEYAKKKIIEEGINKERIIITGQPYLELLLDRAKKSRKKTSKEHFIITYASEPISTSYKGYTKSKYYLEYDEKSILKELLFALEKIQPLVARKLLVILRVHPKEHKNKYFDIIASHRHAKIDFLADDKSDPWDLIQASDLVCGMSSIFLIEAVILNKPILSIQIESKKPNPFILETIGKFHSVSSRKDLMSRLKSVIIDGKYPKYHFDIVKNTVEKVIGEMEKYLCRS